MEERRAVLEKFDKTYHIILHALMSDSFGALTAFRILQRIQSCDRPSQLFHWKDFIEALCRDKPFLEGEEQKLALKPLFHLLPLTCRRNLLSFVQLAQHMIPKDCRQGLIEAIGHDVNSDPWIQAQVGMLKRGLDEERPNWTSGVLTNKCQQHLKLLCKKITDNTRESGGPGRKLGWIINEKQATDLTTFESPGGDAALPQKSRKRKSVAHESCDIASIEQADEKKAKKMKLTEDEIEFWPAEGCASPSKGVGEERTAAIGNGHDVLHSDTKNTDQSNNHKEGIPDLPENIKSCIPRLKELFETEADQKADPKPPSELQILNECNPGQLKLLCSLLRLSELSELMLPQLCTRLTALVPELSYSSATLLAQTLFLNRILCLTEPASRFLVTALTSFCMKYTRPTCNALIGPIVQAPEKGCFQMELVCRLIEDCLEPEYLTLVFGQVLDVPWCEEVLAVVQSLLDKKMELAPELFDQFIGRLSLQAPEFTTSMKYAKLLLAVLTKYQGNITAAHKNTLSCALAMNNTFLKKSLQAALKRIALP